MGKIEFVSGWQKRDAWLQQDAIAAWTAQGALPEGVNPQGGIWVERNDTLYLCQARPKAPAPCVNLSDGSTLAFGDISR
jgi:hypothetical protein